MVDSMKRTRSICRYKRLILRSKNHSLSDYLQLPPSLKSLDSKVFLENIPIFVWVTEVEQTSTTKVLNPNLYTIELSHGDFTWKIKRRFKHFQALHQELLMFKALLKLPLPTCICLVGKDSFVLYMRPKDSQVGMVILYDKGFFHIKMSTQETGVRHAVAIENLCSARLLDHSVDRQIHADPGGRLETELISVHSKLLIADDRTVIIGQRCEIEKVLGARMSNDFI